MCRPIRKQQKVRWILYLSVCWFSLTCHSLYYSCILYPSAALIFSPLGIVGLEIRGRLVKSKLFLCLISLAETISARSPWDFRVVFFSWFSPCTCNDRQIFTMPVGQDVLRLPRQRCACGTVVVVTRLPSWTRNSCCSCSGRQVCNCIRITNREAEQRGQKMRKTSCSSTGMCDDLSTWVRGVQLNQ